MKYLLLTVLLFAGCGERVIQKVYVDENGTEILKYKTIKMEYVCDERGYKYYKQHTYGNDIYLPLFENIGMMKDQTRQVMCK